MNLDDLQWWIHPDLEIEIQRRLDFVEFNAIKIPAKTNNKINFSCFIDDSKILYFLVIGGIESTLISLLTNNIGFTQFLYFFIKLRSPHPKPRSHQPE